MFYVSVAFGRAALAGPGLFLSARLWEVCTLYRPPSVAPDFGRDGTGGLDSQGISTRGCPF